MTNPSPKSVLRTRISAELKSLPSAEKTAASLQLRTLLEQQPLWRNARSILFYAPLPDEPDMWPLLRDALAAGKSAALPRFVPDTNAYAACEVRDLDHDLQTGKFGIREPRDTCARIPLNRLDLMLVPGVAFDLDGFRLGRGKGFYDRLLSELHGPTCGVAFDRQIVPHIPAEPHDIRLSYILTPTRWQCVPYRARF